MPNKKIQDWKMQDVEYGYEGPHTHAYQTPSVSTQVRSGSILILCGYILPCQCFLRRCRYNTGKTAGRPLCRNPIHIALIEIDKCKNATLQLQCFFCIFRTVTVLAIFHNRIHKPIDCVGITQHFEFAI